MMAMLIRLIFDKKKTGEMFFSASDHSLNSIDIVIKNAK